MKALKSCQGVEYPWLPPRYSSRGQCTVYLMTFSYMNTIEDRPPNQKVPDTSITTCHAQPYTSVCTITPEGGHTCVRGLTNWAVSSSLKSGFARSSPQLLRAPSIVSSPLALTCKWGLGSFQEPRFPPTVKFGSPLSAGKASKHHYDDGPEEPLFKRHQYVYCNSYYCHWDRGNSKVSAVRSRSIAAAPGSRLPKGL